MTAANVRAWLDARRPTPPPPLAARLGAALEAYPPERLAAAVNMAEVMGGLGVALLDSLTPRGPTGDDVAMDLLAADAFVTYAFEAAAEEQVAADALAARLLERVGAGA